MNCDICGAPEAYWLFLATKDNLRKETDPKWCMKCALRELGQKEDFTWACADLISPDTLRIIKGVL